MYDFFLKWMQSKSLFFRLPLILHTSYIKKSISFGSLNGELFTYGH